MKRILLIAAVFALFLIPNSAFRNPHSGEAFAYTDVVVNSIDGSNACANPTATISSLASATSGTFAAEIVAASASKKIYICSMTVLGVSGTNPTFSLVYGTGANCASGQGTLVQAFGTTAGSVYTFANPVAVTSASQAVCYKDGGTTPVQNFQITYIQQ